MTNPRGTSGYGPWKPGGLAAVDPLPLRRAAGSRSGVLQSLRGVRRFPERRRERFLLAQELAKLERPARVHIAHMKSGLADTILREIERLAFSHEPAHLARGQVLEF